VTRRQTQERFGPDPGLLEKLGCEVDVAVDGTEALAQLEKRPYDLVLMDCQMPGIDGFEAMERIRALEGEAARTPIAAFTANAMEGDRERCLEAGCTEYATKPIDRVVLIDLCRELVDLERAGAALPTESEESTEHRPADQDVV